MRKLFYILVFLLFASSAFAANYTITTGMSEADGDTFCGGSPCDSDDTIIIQGGARNDLTLKDFDGNGSYINVVDDGSTQAVLTATNGGYGTLTINNCQYLNLHADQNSGETYGIKIINNGTDDTAGLWIRDGSDYIKAGYIEMDMDGCTVSEGGTGVKLLDGTYPETAITTDIELHHMYIYKTNYAGMYLGHGDDAGVDDPWLANIKVHDIILEDLGAYGMNIKGVHSTSGPCEIYNVTVRGSSGGQSTGLLTSKDDSYKTGIGVNSYGGTAYVKIYNCRIEKTVGMGIKAGDDSGSDPSPHLIYNNVVLGCGTGSDEDWGHGIRFHKQGESAHAYDNLVLQATGYGFYSGNVAGENYLSRNLIADCGLGEKLSDPDLVESDPPNQNIYYSSVSSFNFNTWSDDSDYRNDRVLTRGLTPANGATGVGENADLSWTNFTGVTGITLYFQKGVTPPTNKVIDNQDVETYDPGTLDLDSTYYWYIVTHGIEETGAIYSFTTAEGPPPDPTVMGAVKYSQSGGGIKHSPAGGGIK